MVHICFIKFANIRMIHIFYNFNFSTQILSWCTLNLIFLYSFYCNNSRRIINWMSLINSSKASLAESLVKFIKIFYIFNRAYSLLISSLRSTGAFPKIASLFILFINSFNFRLFRRLATHQILIFATLFYYPIIESINNYVIEFFFFFSF